VEHGDHLKEIKDAEELPILVAGLSWGKDKERKLKTTN